MSLRYFGLCGLLATLAACTIPESATLDYALMDKTTDQRLEILQTECLSTGNAINDYGTYPEGHELISLCHKMDAAIRKAGDKPASKKADEDFDSIEDQCFNIWQNARMGSHSYTYFHRSKEICEGYEETFDRTRLQKQPVPATK